MRGSLFGPLRGPGRSVAATVLCFEALVVFFAGLVAKDLPGLSTARALAMAAGLAVALVLAAGLLGRPGGRVLGWLLQLPLLASGFWVSMMWFLGPLFVVLWVAALQLAARLELTLGAAPVEAPVADTQAAKGPSSSGAAPRVGKA